jgi:hypothetical protein
MSDQTPLPPAPADIGPPTPIATEPPKNGGGKGWVVPVAIAVALLAVIAAIAFTSSVRDDAAAGSSSPQGSAPISPGDTAPLTPSAPIALKAAPGSFFVKLTWKPAADATKDIRYEIDRGSEFAGLTDKTSFTDLKVVPTTKYHYTVVALTPDGGRSEESADVAVKTKAAPVSAARLEAIFDINAKSTSHFGFSTFNSNKASFGWRFDPNCGHGACNVKLTDVHKHGFAFQLSRTGGDYHGVLTTKGFGSCNGIVTTATVTVDLHAVTAKAVKDTWRVVRLAGTMTARTSPQLGCVSSGIDYSIGGTLAGVG